MFATLYLCLPFPYRVYNSWLGHCHLLVRNLELEAPHFESRDNVCFSCKHTFPCLAQAPTGSLFLSSWTRCMRPRHTNEVLDQTRQCQYIWSHSSLCHSPSWKWSCLVSFGQKGAFGQMSDQAGKGWLSGAHTSVAEAALLALPWPSCCSIILPLSAVCFDDRDKPQPMNGRQCS